MFATRPQSTSHRDLCSTSVSVIMLRIMLIMMLGWLLLIVALPDLATADEEPTREAIAQELALARNCPNPFNAHTEIVYTLLRPAHVRVDIFDMRGRHVVKLFDEYQNAGENFAVWKTESEASGTYFFRLEVEGLRVYGKMSLIK